MNTLIGPHWAPQHAGQGDDAWIQSLKPPVIKLFAQGDSMPRLDVCLRSAEKLVVLRHHPISENWEHRGIRDVTHAIAMAEGHARCWLDIIRANNIKQLDRIAVEGLNEPRVYSDEPPALLAKYYATLARVLHQSGVKVVVGNFGVGWPADGGTPDSPPVWLPYEEMIEAAYKYGGYLGLHEYWYFSGPKEYEYIDGKRFGGWGWWAGRFRAFPWDIPIIITECGIDAGVIYPGRKDGWLAIPNNNRADIFWNQMVAYEAQCRVDGRVIGITPFTHDFYMREWELFDTNRSDIKNRWLAHAQNLRSGGTQNAEPWPLPYASPPDKPSSGKVPLAKHLFPQGDMIRVLMPNGSIRNMDLEEYLRAVVPAEVPATWPVEAVKAQAVAARTYAKAAMLAPRHGPNADVCTTQHCQVYNPKMIHNASDVAIRATAGEVLTYQGKPIAAFFSANCGGKTRSNSDVWGGDPLPYLKPVECVNKGEKNGHGVGMCQYGARDMARSGASYKDILNHYYTLKDTRDDSYIQDYINNARKALDDLEAFIKSR